MNGLVHQATCVAVDGRGILIEGPPGSGKSSLALALIDRGARLVGDDGVLLEARGANLVASPHPNTSGLLEVRNLGLVSFEPLARIPVALVVRLDEHAPRYIDAPGTCTILAREVPLIRLFPATPALCLRAELALARFGLSA